MNWYKDENRTTGTTDRQSHGGCGGHDIVSILGVIILEEQEEVPHRLPVVPVSIVNALMHTFFIPSLIPYIIYIYIYIYI